MVPKIHNGIMAPADGDSPAEQLTTPADAAGQQLETLPEKKCKTAAYLRGGQLHVLANGQLPRGYALQCARIAEGRSPIKYTCCHLYQPYHTAFPPPKKETARQSQLALQDCDPTLISLQD